MPDPVPSTRVNRLWRTLAIGLMLGITAHAVMNRQAPAVATPPLTIRGDPLPPPDPRLDAMLDSVDFDNVHLADALQNLADRAGLNLVVAWDVLQLKGVLPTDQVTLHLKRVTFAAALDAVLMIHDYNRAASWNEFGGIVHLTAPELEDPSHLLMRLYDVRRILDHWTPGSGKKFADCDVTEAQRREDELRKVICDNVYTATWKDNGGDLGSISSCPGTLLITQKTQAHRMIEALLRKLDNGG